MNQNRCKKSYGISLRIFVLVAVIAVSLTGSIGMGHTANAEKTYGLYVSDLLEYSGAKHAELSPGATNIIKRGRQMFEIQGRNYFSGKEPFIRGFLMDNLYIKENMSDSMLTWKNLLLLRQMQIVKCIRH